MREQLNWRENSLAKEILLLWKTVSMVEPSPPSLLPASTNIKGIRPLPPGFSHVPYGNLEVVEDAITEKTAAVLVEPVQGEGGIILPPQGYLDGLKKICHENDVLLIFDEVQTGFGRTGEMFASQKYKVTPDITTLAKAIAGGFPMGAILASEEVETLLNLETTLQHLEVAL